MDFVSPIGYNSGAAEDGSLIDNIAVVRQNNNESVKNEFAALFYKEILKENFKEFSMAGDGIYSKMVSDVMLDTMAKEMAARNSSILEGFGKINDE